MHATKNLTILFVPSTNVTSQCSTTTYDPNDNWFANNRIPAVVTCCQILSETSSCEKSLADLRIYQGTDMNIKTDSALADNKAGYTYSYTDTEYDYMPGYQDRVHPYV